MSAFVVSERHISAIVSYGALRSAYYRKWDGEMVAFKGNEQAIGEKLWVANIASVNARYPSDTHDYGAFTFKRETEERVMRPIQIVKACGCFDYQACEVDDYELTAASAITRAVIDSTLHHLPGYGAADWEIKGVCTGVLLSELV